MAGRAVRIVIVEDQVRFLQVIQEAVVSALAPQQTEVVASWAASLDVVRRTGNPPILIVPMTHDDALARRDWSNVHTVFIDTHDHGRSWQHVPADEPREPVYAGAEVAARLLRLDPRPRVICYSSQLDNPLVRVMLWQQTGDGQADAYYDATALGDPDIVRSALRDAQPIGQARPPAPRDYTQADLAFGAPIAEAVRAARSSGHWNLLASARGYATLGRSGQKFLQRYAKRLLGKGDGRAAAKVIRAAASGEKPSA